MDKLFFDNWDALLRTLVIGVMAYVTLVVFLRISGRRTLSKLNAFDMVVTVALGSTLATILLNKNTTLAQGALAFGLLIAMQYLVTWSSVRVAWVRKTVTGEPALLVYQSEYLPEALVKARVTREEVRAALRAAGLQGIEGVKAVVLETDGSISVVKSSPEHDSSALRGVKIPGRSETLADKS